MAWVAGVDGCRAGWIVLLRNTASGKTRHHLVKHLADVLGLPEKPVVVAVDIPIGLLEHALRGGRKCDQEAREILKQPRARSVFSPPARGALKHSEYSAANRANRASSAERIGISRQSFALREKLVEADQFIKPGLQDRVREVHPELCFYQLNGGQAMNYGKKKPEGLSERRRLLLSAGFDRVMPGICAYRRREVAEDDFLDACVACWTAIRISERSAMCIPEKPPLDSRGLRMEMWR